MQDLTEQESRFCPGTDGERASSRLELNWQEADVGKGKMSGDNSADSKRGTARGSGGTMKNQNPGKQDNNKAQNTKSNKQ